MSVFSINEFREKINTNFLASKNLYRLSVARDVPGLNERDRIVLNELFSLGAFYVNYPEEYYFSSYSPEKKIHVKFFKMENRGEFMALKILDELFDNGVKIDLRIEVYGKKGNVASERVFKNIKISKIYNTELSWEYRDQLDSLSVEFTYE